jgi:hypothetical protein
MPTDAVREQTKKKSVSSKLQKAPGPVTGE